MRETDGSSWTRKGCSIVWSPELLGPLITGGDAVPLRVALGWLETGFPDSPPGDRNPILVGGLQTALMVLPTPDARFQWLRQNIFPLAKGVGNHWARVGIVFAMDGPGKLFSLNEADDLVYFGRGSDRTDKVEISGGQGQVQHRVATIGLNVQGERSRPLEQLDDALLRLEPAGDSLLDPIRRTDLVRNVVPEMIRRDLAHAGVLTDGASFAARLLAWVEVN